ncbi:hypothetical protein NtRootA1_38340 [Arthrobacter sp. NtRootA1]|nr:hypothetical protein NtRootA1_38340 [Arthrobacter sp. NtRootA1]
MEDADFGLKPLPLFCHAAPLASEDDDGAAHVAVVPLASCEGRRSPGRPCGEGQENIRPRWLPGSDGYFCGLAGAVAVKTGTDRMLKPMGKPSRVPRRVAGQQEEWTDGIGRKPGHETSQRPNNPGRQAAKDLEEQHNGRLSEMLQHGPCSQGNVLEELDHAIPRASADSGLTKEDIESMYRRASWA